MNSSLTHAMPHATRLQENEAAAAVSFRRQRTKKKVQKRLFGPQGQEVFCKVFAILNLAFDLLTRLLFLI